MLKHWWTFALQRWHDSVSSNILNIFSDLQLTLSLSSPVFPHPPPLDFTQQATLELLHFLLFLSTPSSHPPSLPPLSSFTPSAGKSSSWFFSLKRAEENWILAALPFPELLLQTEEGGGRREERGRKGGNGGGGLRKKRGENRLRKVLCGAFLKPKVTTGAADEFASERRDETRTWGERRTQRRRFNEHHTALFLRLFPGNTRKYIQQKSRDRVSPDLVLAFRLSLFGGSNLWSQTETQTLTVVLTSGKGRTSQLQICVSVTERECVSPCLCVQCEHEAGAGGGVTGQVPSSDVM